MKVGFLRFLRPAGVLLLSVAIGLAMCEGTLRLVFALGLLADDNSWVALVRSVHHRDPSLAASGQQLFRRSPNRVLGWEPVPGFASGHVRINSAGFRGAEIERHPPAGTVRIAVLGESETFAMRLPEEQSVPGVVRQILSSRFAGRRFEVLNFGVPGYNTIQELELLKTKVSAFHPDAVVLYYSLNDPEIEDRTLLMGDGGFRTSYVYLLYVSVRQSYSGLVSLQALARGEAEYYHLLHASEFFDRTRGALESMASQLNEEGVPFLVAISPALSGYDDLASFPYWEIHRLLQELDGAGIEVIDPTPAIVARFRDPRQLWVAPDDPHKNHLANLVVGEAIAGAVAERLY